MVMATASDVWTADMLDDVPDDGRRWAVIDGRLLVTPGPDVPHQFVVGEVQTRLHNYFGRVADARLLTSPGLDHALVISLPELFADASRGL